MQHNPKGISFKTAAGNSYFYNDSTATVTPESYINPNGQQTGLVSTFTQDTKTSGDSNKTQLRQTLLDEGYTQLTLVTTERCNLRCKYCIYSGQYNGNRIHSDICMEWGIAEKAINTYMKGFTSAQMRRPQLLLQIGFYGGEPLLNYSLIRNTVDYVKKRYRGNPHYSLTTNGTILTTEMLNFFRDNDYQLMFSLNGNRAEHDRLRVFPDGHGSFDLIWHNLQTIRRIDPDYFQHNCSFIIVYDVGTDLKKLCSFLENRRKLLPAVYRISRVKSEFTQYYTRYSTKDVENFNEDMKYFQKMYLDTLLAGENPSLFLTTLVGQGLKDIIQRIQNIPLQPRLIPFTATCIPGAKMAVYADGSLHCCEKINHHFPIGNVASGFDDDLILNLIKKYNNQIVSQCFDCPVTRLCRYCFASFADDGIFQKDPPDCCQKTIESFRNALSIIYTLFEKGVPESAFT